MSTSSSSSASCTPVPDAPPPYSRAPLRAPKPASTPKNFEASLAWLQSSYGVGAHVPPVPRPKVKVATVPASALPPSYTNAISSSPSSPPSQAMASSSSDSPPSSARAGRDYGAAFTAVQGAYGSPGHSSGSVPRPKAARRENSDAEAVVGRGAKRVGSRFGFLR